MKTKNDDMYIFTDDELKEINEIRKSWSELTEREKFIVKEALKVFLYKKND